MNRNIFLQTAENLVGPDMDLQLRYVHTTPNLLQFRRAFEATSEVTAHMEINRVIKFATAAEDCDAQDKEIFAWIEAA